MAFPNNPTDGQIYNKSIYNGTTQAWEDYISLPTTYPSNENLLAHYSLSDGDGVGGAVATYHLDGNALDSSGNGNHGTTTNVTFTEGTAVFNGTSSNVNLGKPHFLKNEFSISVHYQLDLLQLETYAKVISIGDISNTQSMFYFGPRNIGESSIIWVFYDGTTYLIKEIYDGYDTNEHHFVVTYNSPNRKIYFDGVLIENNEFNGDWSAFTMENWSIGGAFNALGVNNLAGKVWEVNAFDRELSAQEVTELYTNPRNENLNLPTLPNDPIGQWDLNGDSNDSSGNGYHGVDTDVTYVQGKKDNLAGEFDGTSSIINIDKQVFFNSEPRTFCAWVKRGLAGDSFGEVINNHFSGQLQVMNDGAIRFGYYYNSSWHHTIYSKIILDKWNHIAATLYTDGTNIIAKVFINGIYDSNAIYTGNSISDSSILKIGAFNIGLEMFQGSIEQVKLFNRVLSNQEILALAEQTHPIQDNSLTRLDGYIKPPVSYGKAKKGKGINFASNYSGLNIGKIDIGHDGTISTWFNCEGDTGRFQTILSQADTSFGYAIFLNPVTGYMTIKGAGIDTTIATNYFDNTSHFLVMKWDSNNVYVLVDGIVVYSSGSPANTLRNSDFIIGNRKDAGQIQEKSFIGEEYTNLVADPTALDLWATKNNCTVTDSGQIINGYKFWQLETVSGDSMSAIAQLNFTDLTGDSYFGIIIKYVNTDKVKIGIGGLTSGSVFCRIEFSSKTITFDGGIGEILQGNEIWFDDDTIFLPILAPTSETSGTPVDLQLFVNNIDAETQTGDKVLYSQPILVDNTTTMFPFVDGTHNKNVINKTFTMPDRFAVDLEIESRFAFDTAIEHRVIAWNVSGTQRLNIYYWSDGDRFLMLWQDNNLISMTSQQFDDGTSYTNLNQKIRITVFLNLLSGGINDSMFTIIPSSTNIAVTDNSWSGTPDVKTTDFPTLSIGNNVGKKQADSDIEYIKIYEWDGIKPTITNNTDVDNYFNNKLPLFNFNTKENYIDKEQIYQGYNFNGVISDVRFYDTMLTTKETRALMTRDK